MLTTLANDAAIADLIRSGNIIPLLAITLSILAGMVGIVGWTITSVVRTRAREQTKRELAAYVAEGTLDPDKAVALANAGMMKWQCCDSQKMGTNT